MTTSTQPDHASYSMPSLEQATVADVMHPGLVSCRPDATLADVAQTMAAYRVHCVAVMTLAHDRSGESYVWGIISDLDLLHAGIREGQDKRAGDLAGQPVISVRPTMPLRDAGELMLTHGINHLVVIEIESQRPVGILSTLDIAGVLARERGRGRGPSRS